MRLGRLIAMRCLLDVGIPPFDYINVDGGKMNNYQYNVETIYFWPWRKRFVMENTLKGD
jgi:hypothetical protein